METRTAAWPGWYPDYDDELLYRWWDGERWSHVQAIRTRTLLGHERWFRCDTAWGRFSERALRTPWRTAWRRVLPASGAPVAVCVLKFPVYGWWVVLPALAGVLPVPAFQLWWYGPHMRRWLCEEHRRFWGE